MNVTTPNLATGVSEPIPFPWSSHRNRLVNWSFEGIRKEDGCRIRIGGTFRTPDEAVEKVRLLDKTYILTESWMVYKDALFTFDPTTKIFCHYGLLV